MSVSKKNSGIRLPEALTAETAVECHALFLKALRGKKAVVVDGSAVEVAGTPGVQLLLAVEAASRAKGLALSIPSPSAVLTEAMERLGCRHLLSEPADA